MGKKLKKRKDGRYADYIVVGRKSDGKEKRKWAYAKTLAELEDKMTKLKYEYKNRNLTNTKNKTYQEWSEEFFKLYKSGKELNTQKMYKDNSRLHIYPLLGKMLLKDIKEIHIKNIVNILEEEKKYRTAEIVLMTVNAVLDSAVANGFVNFNCAKNISLNKHQSAEKQPLSSFHKEIYEHVCKTHKYGTFFMVILYTGMRTEEIVPLTFRKIELEISDFQEQILCTNSYFDISNSVTFGTNQVIEIKGTKNKRSRKIPIFVNIFDLVKELKNKCNSLDDLVFQKATGGMHTKSSIKSAVKSFIYACNKEIDKRMEQEISQNPKNAKEIVKKYEELGYMYFTMHILRHTFACILYKAGVKLKDAQEIMGHNSSQMLDEVYIHLDKEDNLTATIQVNKYLIDSKNNTDEANTKYVLDYISRLPEDAKKLIIEKIKNEI